jgi:hypothetical protein
MLLYEMAKSIVGEHFVTSPHPDTLAYHATLLCRSGVIVLPIPYVLAAPMGPVDKVSLFIVSMFNVSLFPPLAGYLVSSPVTWPINSGADLGHLCLYKR